MRGKFLLFFLLMSSLLLGDGNMIVENIGVLEHNGQAHYSNKVSGNLRLVRLGTTITSDKDRVKVGEIIGFNIKVKNFYTDDVGNFITTIVLPGGFTFLKNSAHVDKGKIVTTMGEGGAIKVAHTGKLRNGEELTVYISAQVNINSSPGENKVTTFSQGDIAKNTEGSEGTIVSNTSTVKIIVDQEENERKGVIIGRVFIDTNRNGLYDKEEMGVPGVKIYLENGHFSVTDGEGRYSLFGERAITHVVRLDEFSAPKGGKLIKIDNRYSENGNQAFADLKRDELYKVNFAYGEVNEQFLDEMKSREDLKKAFPKEIKQVIEKEELTFASITAGDTVNASGFFSSDGVQSLAKAIEDIEKDKRQRLLDEYMAKQEKEKKTPEEELQLLKDKLEKMDNSLGFMNLKDGQLVSGTISVQVKGKMGSQINISVNGEKVPYKLLGSTGNAPKTDLSFFQYDGVKLKPEKNIIRAEMEVDGKVVGTKEVTVIYPENVKKIELIYDKNDATTNITKPMKMELLIEDGDNHRVTIPYFVSITNDGGNWIAPEDISKTDDGLQFIADNGSKILEFMPPPEPGKVKFIIRIGDLERKYEINFRAPERPLLMTGIIEGRVDFKDGGGGGFFQDVLSGHKENKDTNFSHRTALFTTGSVGNNYNLTLSYDNTKNNEDVFFQKIKKDDYFLVFGDDSIRGYDAQSMSHLYLLLDNGTSSYLYGDYTIDWSADEVDIGSYSRTLNGYKYAYDGEKLKAEAFFSHTNTVKEVEEFPGRDISGPYALGKKGIIENSERITILRYNKNNLLEPPLEVAAPEYTIDYDIGVIYFSTIIPKLDAKGNPLFIRVTYEVEDASGKKYNVYGGRTSYKVTDYLSLGGAYVRDENPEKDYENKSVNVVLDGKNLGKLTFEAGETSNLRIKGKAHMVKYINDQSQKLQSKMIYYDSDEGFKADGAFVKPDSRLFSMNNTYKIDDANEIHLEGYEYKDKKENKKYKELYFAYKRIINNNSSLELGTKYSNGEAISQTDDLVTVGAKYTWSLKSIPDLLNYIEYEQDVNDSHGRRLSAASEYSPNKYLKLYGKYDFVNTLKDTHIINRYNSTFGRIFGIEFGSIEYIQPYIEYRKHTGDTDTTSEIAYGFKSDYAYSENLSFRGVLEKVSTLSNTKTGRENEKTSLVVSYIYSNEESNTMSTGSMDLTRESEKTSILMKGGYGFKINDDLTFAVKDRYYVQDMNSDHIRNRLLLGIAYRDLEDEYNSLWKYESVYDDKIENKLYTHNSHVINTIHNYQPNRENIWTFSVGSKFVKDSNEYVSKDYLAYLVGINWKYFLTEKIDLGINSAAYLDTQSNKRYGLGLEVGYTINDLFWISLGYNFLGFEDKDFYEDDRYRKGLYLRFRMKLSEGIFSRFN